MEERLANFRQQWKNELSSSPTASRKPMVQQGRMRNSPAKEKAADRQDDINANIQEEKVSSRVSF